MDVFKKQTASFNQQNSGVDSQVTSGGGQSGSRGMALVKNQKQGPPKVDSLFLLEKEIIRIICQNTPRHV